MMKRDDSPSTLVTAGTDSFSESEDSASPFSMPPVYLPKKGVRADSTAVCNKSVQKNRGNVRRHQTHAHRSGREHNSTPSDENDDTVVVIVEIPPHLPVLWNSDQDDSKRPGLWSCRATHRRKQPHNQALHRTFAWDEDNLSSAAVWSEEESLGDVGTEGSSSYDKTPVTPTIEPPIGVIEEKQLPRFRLLRSLPRFLTTSRRSQLPPAADTTKQNNIEWFINSFGNKSVQSANTLAENLAVDDSSLPVQLLSRKQIVQVRREQLGFARTVAMDGILESFSDVESRYASRACTPSDITSRTFMSTPPRSEGGEQMVSPDVLPSLPVDYSRFLKEQAPQNNRVVVPNVLVWI
jgi:hypothetical protein